MIQGRDQDVCNAHKQAVPGMQQATEFAKSVMVKNKDQQGHAEKP